MSEVDIMSLYWLGACLIFVIVTFIIGRDKKMSREQQASNRAHERYKAIQKQRIQKLEEPETVEFNPYVEGTLRYELWERER